MKKVNSNYLYIIFLIMTLGIGILFTFRNKKITIFDITKAQNEWADELIKIGFKYKNGKKYKKEASKMIDRLYAYDLENYSVLFKPTKASQHQFRKTKEEAMSYFITGKCCEDKGFAFEPWKKVVFENSQILFKEDSATVMGNYYFTNYENKTIKVEYTFEYVKTSSKKLKIILHHSSFPYNE